jgi:uncharacterized membrane protein
MTAERPDVIADLARRPGLASRDQVFLGVALALSSLAALAVLAARFVYSGTAGYAFMVWNLFLAWIPLALALPIRFDLSRGRRGIAVAAGLAFLWLLFFPNAPYLLTEFQHLHPQHAVSARPIRLLSSVSPVRGVPLWYDVLLLLLFAWNGLLLGFVSLRIVQRAVSRRAGAAWGWVTVVLVLGLSGFGVSIGRFERWNSWDLFSRPAALLADVAGRLFNPLAHPRTTAVTVLFAGFLLLAYVTVMTLARSHDGADENRGSGAVA